MVNGYLTRGNCLNGIESVRKHAIDDSYYASETASNGKPYFNLRSGNGQIIGTSEMREKYCGHGEVALLL